MLVELRIRDFAIIDELDITFGPGFSVLTGETGAGKSIIVDSVALVLGERADSSVVRAGSSRAIIEASFLLLPDEQAALAPVLQQEGLEGDDPGTLLVGREIRLGGRNICRVNGRSVSLNVLRSVAEGLVDIHGQTEHLSLLRVREQLNLLDRYADTLALRQVVAGLVGDVREVRRELSELVGREEELARRSDLLEFQIREIETASLLPGEEEELLVERVRLANAEQLVALLGDALRALDEGRAEEPSALDLTGTAVRALEGLARVDATLRPYREAGEQVIFKLEELARSLGTYREQIEVNPRRLSVVEERLGLIRRLKRKYGGSVEDVLAYVRRASEELESLARSDERVAQLSAAELRLLEELGSKAVALSRERRQAARLLSKAIEDELQELNMEGSRFGVSFEWREDADGVPVAVLAASPSWLVTAEGKCAGQEDAAAHCELSAAFDSSGIDRIEFMVSPNLGEPLKPVNKIASGGETSRIMLALKAVLSRADATPTLIFDEIDQGIGGRVGAIVGEKLWGLTTTTPPNRRGRQVLCVTHLPQLAGFGDDHLHVEKQVVGDRTVTRVRPLRGMNRVVEVATMLGTAGPSGRDSAQVILKEIADRKLSAGPTEP